MIPNNKIEELKIIREKIQNCHGCSLREQYNKPVACAGSPIAQIMFIGEAPGAEETDQGKPFVGASGKMLRNAIIDAGIDLEDVFITNVLCCRPLNNIFPNDINYIYACRHWLREQIQFIQPKIIVSIGGKPHKYVRNSDIGITKACGKWEKHTFDLYDENNNIYKYETWYLATLHPSFCMRGPDNRYPNTVMQLDREGKINLFREHIASIKTKIGDLS